MWGTALNEWYRMHFLDKQQSVVDYFIWETSLIEQAEANMLLIIVLPHVNMSEREHTILSPALWQLFNTSGLTLTLISCSSDRYNVKTSTIYQFISRQRKCQMSRLRKCQITQKLGIIQRCQSQCGSKSYAVEHIYAAGISGNYHSK